MAAPPPLPSPPWPGARELISLLFGRGDDDFHQRRRTAELDRNARTRRRIFRVDPGEPRLVHRVLLRHIRYIDGRREQLRLVRAALFEVAVDLLEHFFGLLLHPDR